ncbi:EAL domain-containing protein [Vibrio sp. PID17_43]|uniref:EAL domain-containing protein n=1 Tax=Vibrio sp. PID17_43 TaxID=1583451 RepID=UPI003460D477
MENNIRAKTLVRNIASLSRELGMTIVAEGVETPNQARNSKRGRLMSGIGFYFYKPMPLKGVFEPFSTR